MICQRVQVKNFIGTDHCYSREFICRVAAMEQERSFSVMVISSLTENSKKGINMGRGKNREDGSILYDGFWVKGRREELVKKSFQKKTD